MSRQEFNFDNFEECDNCGCTEVNIETVVSETAMHRDGRREFKGGGSVIAELSAYCPECDHTHWKAEDYEVVEDEPIGSSWEYGEKCPECESDRIEEWHVDEKMRNNNGTQIYDGDRFRTEAYYCIDCNTLLDKLEE